MAVKPDLNEKEAPAEWEVGDADLLGLSRTL